MIEHQASPTAPDVAATPATAGRHAFQKEVASDFTQAEGCSAALSVVVAGLDGFRLVNDSLGSELGDSVLERFRGVVDSRTGSAYRLSGDVFASVLSAMSGQSAVALAEELRESVGRGIQTPIGGVEVSLGVASYPECAASAAELQYGAEAAMHWAKATGGNKVGYWGELVCAEVSGWRRKGSVSEPISALVATLERKTWTPAGQTGRSAWYAKRVAKELGLSQTEQDTVEVAALLHDVGKLAISDEILLKPGALTEEEKAIARQHPLMGRDILSRIPSLAAAVPIVYHHHEHYDGSGYPDHLAGEAIPTGSRIILVSDSFDAMTTHRSYRSVLSLQMATRELERCGGRQFDPRVVEAFVRIVSRQGLNALHWSRGGGR